MAFGTADIATYVSSMEATTLDKLFSSTSGYSSGISGGICLYGRNAGTPGSPKYKDSTVPNTLLETYSCTGYGSPQALKSMADRHDHSDAKAFLARWTKHYMSMLRWNLNKHGWPPGEDNHHEPLAPRNTGKDVGKGDTDIHRHHDAFGHCQILCDPAYKTLGGWTSDDAIGTAKLLKEWLIEESRNIGSKGHIREYLRWGNRLNTLAGIYDVFQHYERYSEASRVLDLGAALVNLIYQSGWSTTETGQVTTETFQIWNYGDFVDGDSKQDPFYYGFKPWTSQPWYDGHQILGLYNLGLRLLSANLSEAYASDTTIYNTSTVWGTETLTFDAGDTTQTTVVTNTYFVASLDTYNVAYQQCVAVVDAMTKWYCYAKRKWAPLGDYSSHGSQDFVNCKLHGMKSDTTTHYIVDKTAADVMTLQQWNDLAEDEEYVRLHALDVHESDGQYWRILDTDTNGVLYKRSHHPRRTTKFDVSGDIVAGYDTNDPYWHVRWDVWQNSYLIPDMLWIRGLINNDDDEKDFARIAMFDYLAFANTNDKNVKKEDRLSTSTGWCPPAAFMNFGRSWHWAIQAGHLIRASDLAV